MAPSSNKKRVINERGGPGSSSGDSSTSGKPSQSAVSSSSVVSTHSRPHGNYDGNRDPAARANPELEKDLKNVDLGLSAYAILRGADSAILEPRPKASTLGTAIKIGLNSFQVKTVPTKQVYQYEILVGSGVEKRGLVKKVWESKALKQALDEATGTPKSAQPGAGFIFDGNRLAWALKSVSREVKIMVDLDAEEGRKPREGKENVHRVVIRQTNAVRFDNLAAFLDGKTTFDNNCLQAINFLDHLLREYPGTKYTTIKRNFFARGDQRFPLGGGVEAFKGVYQSMRVVHGGAKARLAINIDVANGTFWSEQKLTNAAVQLTNCRDINDMTVALQKGGEKSHYATTLKRMRKLHVYANHRGVKDQYVIDKFVYQSARKYTFEKDGNPISIYDYYQKKYNHRLQYPDLPLVKVTKGKNTVLPMEALIIAPNERFAYKMDEKQTSNMIKFAVEPPPQRWQAIEHGLKMVDWPTDPVHKHFGLEIDPRKQVVDARLIPAPIVKFGSGDAKPGTSGRWDLKGKKFLAGNPAPLKAWGVCVVTGRRGGKPDKTVVERFIAQFVSIYKGHGGKVENAQPALTLGSGDDASTVVTSVWNAAGNQVQMRPQILVFILPDKDSVVYGRIKRSCECRYGVVSQCMQYSHVQKAQPQYISNVCMKFNAKLGGTTCRAIGQKTGGPTGIFKVPTMVIGADVSHAAPGAQTPSMAAITMSIDQLACRYMAMCQTNGFRVEMITTETINTELKGMIQTWMQQVGGGKLPQRIIYFRDGVSEGQYAHVLEQEVRDMKTLLQSASPQGANVQFVVIVGSKRHHVRFFPEKGDRNGNAFPGTLVETGVTHPYENDFYLCSHAAIKGTARPMHYYVLLNEAKMPNEEIQTLIYEHSYQYMRATTPVSQHPAMYYAHIASQRAISHDQHFAGSSGIEKTPEAQPLQAGRPRSASQSGSQSGGRTGSQAGSGGDPTGSSSTKLVDVEKLLDMPNQGNIRSTMWYI